MKTKSNTKTLSCKVCGTKVERVGIEAAEVICSSCAMNSSKSVLTDNELTEINKLTTE